MTDFWLVVLFLCGAGAGAAAMFALMLIVDRQYLPGLRAPRSHLPPASARQRRRAERASRLRIEGP